MASTGSGYRTHLKGAVAASAAPYGYTLTIWTSGAVATHGHGIPTAWEALLFLGGAVVGFAVTAAIAHGSHSATFARDQYLPVRVWGGFHLVSVGAAIGLSAVASKFVQSPEVWLVVGFVATAVYLTAVAAQFTIAERHEPEPANQEPSGRQGASRR